MSFEKLRRYEAERKKEREERAAMEAEREARRKLREAVKSVIPKRVLKVPKRKAGRAAVGGVSRKEVTALRIRAEGFLDGDAGMDALQTEVQHTALVILLIDGVLGTEPWRTQGGGPHGGLIAANARLRYLENAARLLDDLRRSRGRSDEPGNKLLEGVLDAEVVELESK